MVSHELDMEYFGSNIYHKRKQIVVTFTYFPSYYSMVLFELQLLYRYVQLNTPTL